MGVPRRDPPRRRARRTSARTRLAAGRSVARSTRKRPYLRLSVRDAEGPALIAAVLLRDGLLLGRHSRLLSHYAQAVGGVRRTACRFACKSGAARQLAHVDDPERAPAAEVVGEEDEVRPSPPRRRWDEESFS